MIFESPMNRTATPTREMRWYDIRFIHISRSNRSRLVSLVHKRHHLLVTIHDKLGQILNVRSQAWVFTDSKIACVLRIQKIPYFLVVNLWNV
jgi:hypothetical protein